MNLEDLIPKPFSDLSTVAPISFVNLQNGSAVITILSPTLLTPSRKVPKQRTNGYTIDLVNGDIIATKDWFQTEVDTDEETIENYLEVWYLEDNVRRQFPDLHIFNSYIGTLLSSFIELEILLIEREDLDLIPTGTPMEYNTR